MGKIGQLRTTESIDKGQAEIRHWLDMIHVNGMNVILQYDARQNIAVCRFTYKTKEYEFRSTKQSNCRLNMHGIARVMEFKVRAHLMGIEQFDTSMQAYLRIENQSGYSEPQKVPVSEKHYAVLGLTSLESNDEIKQRYRTLCKTFHPDMALSPEAKEEFTKRFADINNAYGEIQKERGL